jgi:hypothetical protein
MKSILGNSPITTIAGFILAGLLVAQQMLQEGVTDWWRIALAVGIAILGRVSADDQKA